MANRNVGEKTPSIRGPTMTAATTFTAPITTGLILSAVYAVLAHWAFRAAVERARQTGLLLKMSE